MDRLELAGVGGGAVGEVLARTTPALLAPADDAGADGRAEIIRLRREIFARQRQIINEHVRGYDRDFLRYERRYKRAVRNFDRPATLAEIDTAALESDVVYVGDYHTLRQSQRAYVELVRRLAGRGRELVLALEFVPGRADEAAERFLRGRLSEAAFLRRIDYERRRGAGIWRNFKPIFEAARELELPLIGLERARSGTLEERDRYAARRIATALRRRPGALVLVLSGQLHCAPMHLPQAVNLALGKRRPRPLVVYQNAEPIYWELERTGHEHELEAVRIRQGEYCLFTASPLVAQQSYLDWLEDDGETMEAEQAERRFKELAGTIAGFFGVELRDALDRVSVYSGGDLSFIPRLRASGTFSRRELTLIRRQVLARESYYIPRAHIAYLAGLSLAHAAEEAAHFLRHVACGEEEPQRNLLDSFYGRALEEALAFFGSKVVVPGRRAATVEDFQRLRRHGTAGERQVAENVLAHKALEAGRRAPRLRQLYASDDIDLFNAVTHALGYMLGDLLYRAFVRGRLSKQEARELFLDPFEESGDAFHTYFGLVARFTRPARAQVRGAGVTRRAAAAPAPAAGGGGGRRTR